MVPVIHTYKSTQTLILGEDTVHKRRKDWAAEKTTKSAKKKTLGVIGEAEEKENGSTKKPQENLDSTQKRKDILT